MKLYVLLCEEDVLGVYSSKKKLEKAVDHFLSVDSYCTKKVMHYQKFYVNDHYADSWDYCYIPAHSDINDLEAGGSDVPDREYWGKNITRVEWTHEESDVIKDKKYRSEVLEDVVIKDCKLIG
ncbi:MAG: hypothetical protein ABFD50_04540 [Smithella sp.]